jgi:hypothetical protein
MKFILYKDKTVKNFAGNETVWIEAGMYPVVRMFDLKRVLVDVGKAARGKEGDNNKQLTVLALLDGEVVNG